LGELKLRQPCHLMSYPTKSKHTICERPIDEYKASYGSQLRPGSSGVGGLGDKVHTKKRAGVQTNKQSQARSFDTSRNISVAERPDPTTDSTGYISLLKVDSTKALSIARSKFRRQTKHENVQWTSAEKSLVKIWPTAGGAAKPAKAVHV
jgi:hypothetical protein